MRVLLLHLDGKLPNVALMRIAAHHRALGDDVELRHAPTVASVEPEFGDDHDRVYASLIFERTRPVATRLAQALPDAIIGGTGWNLTTKLEGHGITTREQDYTIYPRFKPSIGFSQRGCRLKCGFCVVPKKEGAITEEQTIAQLWRGEPWPRHALLLDNDFFGQPNWRDRIAEIRDGGFKVCFSQGINARMLSEEAAEAIGSVHYSDDSFKVRRIYTAWDSRPDEGVLFRGLERLVKYGVKPDHIMVYMLIGYDDRHLLPADALRPGVNYAPETHADRDYRRQRLRDFGARPYPMPFVRTPELIAFQRWVIGAYDKTIPWEAWASAKGQPQNLGSPAQTSMSMVARRPLPVIGGAQ